MLRKELHFKAQIFPTEGATDVCCTLLFASSFYGVLGLAWLAILLKVGHDNISHDRFCFLSLNPPADSFAEKALFGNFSTKPQHSSRHFL